MIPEFPRTVSPRHDADLSVSYHHHVETVPTLLRVEDGGRSTAPRAGRARLGGAEPGSTGLGADLPDSPSRVRLAARVDPEMADDLRVRYEGGILRARRVELGDLEDEMEAMYDRGWTDGLPVVPPTEAAGAAHAGGHHPRRPTRSWPSCRPTWCQCTVEKVAINAVMAGCRPEYLPVVLAAVEAACTDEFNMHGVLATTCFVGPVVDRQRARSPGASA